MNETDPDELELDELIATALALRVAPLDGQPLLEAALDRFHRKLRGPRRPATGRRVGQTLALAATAAALLAATVALHPASSDHRMPRPAAPLVIASAPSTHQAASRPAAAPGQVSAPAPSPMRSRPLPTHPPSSSPHRTPTVSPSMPPSNRIDPTAPSSPAPSTTGRSLLPPGGAQPERPPRTRSPRPPSPMVRLGPGDDGRTVSLVVGGNIRLTLPEDSDAASWQIAAPDPDGVLSPRASKSSSNGVTAMFRAVGAGRTTLTATRATCAGSGCLTSVHITVVVTAELTPVLGTG